MMKISVNTASPGDVLLPSWVVDEERKRKDNYYLVVSTPEGNRLVNLPELHMDGSGTNYSGGEDLVWYRVGTMKVRGVE